MTLVRRILLFLILTIFTQIGGVVYLLVIPLRKPVQNRLTAGWQQIVVRDLLFLAAYLTATLRISPVSALNKDIGNMV